MTTPMHPFAVPNSPTDTLTRCIDVLVFVGQENPPGCVSDELERGRVWVLQGVADALRSLVPPAEADASGLTDDPMADSTGCWPGR